jgi:hypothetical protein
VTWSNLRQPVATASGQSPIFDKTQQLLVWLLPHTVRFPQAERFRLKQRVEDTAFEFHELLVQKPVFSQAPEAKRSGVENTGF